MDQRQSLVRITYRFTHDRPDEEFLVDGVPVQPVYGKVHGLRYFDRVLLNERIVWLPLGAVRVRLDGRTVDECARASRNARCTPWAGGRCARSSIRCWSSPPPRCRRPSVPLRDRAILRLARSQVVRKYFGKSWVLMDRIHDADDSAERLFRYLRKRKRAINAWFVIEGGHRRLPAHAQGRPARVVPHGSLRWKLLMLNCEHLISSHADVRSCTHARSRGW